MNQLLSTRSGGEQLQSLRPALLRVPRFTSHEEPEDLVQEAFLRALSRPDVDPDRLGGWLRTVVTNLGHDASRRKRSACTAMARLAKAEMHEPDPADTVADHYLAKSVAGMVEDLPRLQREVLHEVANGCSIAEVAAAKGLTLRAAEGHLRRARAAVRKEIAR
jgi:RNA polymerase sigma factor (sigma-70 family)